MKSPVIITAELLIELMPECSEIAGLFVEPLNQVFATYEINTLWRQSSFLAQAGHESVRFTTLAQNLNYSTKGLLRVYPQYFTLDQATEYAHKPLRIASRIFAGRMGNRDEASTDGWWYRSRGLFPRILGASGYRRCSEGLTNDPAFLLKRPELLSTPLWACRAAGWFWDTNSCNDIADDPTEQSFRRLTRRINGGLHGIQDRLYLYERAKRLLSGEHLEITIFPPTPLPVPAFATPP